MESDHSFLATGSIERPDVIKIYYAREFCLLISAARRLPYIVENLKIDDFFDLKQITMLLSTQFKIQQGKDSMATYKMVKVPER